MVAAKSPSATAADHPIRPPLIPSGKDNASISFLSRKPRTKEITSRYLSSNPSNYAPSPSTSSSSSSSRRFPSPMMTPRPSTPSTLSSSKRSHSVDRSRPSTPTTASRSLCTTTRSLSVSFQGESFFYQTSKAPIPVRKPTPERRKSDQTKTEYSRPEQHHHRWPAVRSSPSSLTKSMDFGSSLSNGKKDPILATAVRLLQQSSVLPEDGTRRISFDGVLDSDSESVSSGSNSNEGGGGVWVPERAKVTNRGISVPARFWQETNSRMRRLPEPGIKSPVLRKSLGGDTPLASPRSAASPIRAMRAGSPSRGVVGSPSGRGMASPLRGRGGNGLGGGGIGERGVQVGNAPSIISFAAEVRRAKKGESRIEEAHVLRLLHNRFLEWRWVNARANAASMVQRLVVEKNLYHAWITTSELRDSVTIRRIKLQVLAQSLKLTSILKGQMTFLEEWSLMDRDHTSSLSGAIEALKASTLRLPVVGGARAELQELRDAVLSAVDVMQTMGSSICSLLTKVEGTSSLVSELSPSGSTRTSFVGSIQISIILCSRYACKTVQPSWPYLTTKMQTQSSASVEQDSFTSTSVITNTTATFFLTLTGDCAQGNKALRLVGKLTF